MFDLAFKKINESNDFIKLILMVKSQLNAK